MAPSRVILTVAILALAAVAIGRQVGQYQLEQQQQQQGHPHRPAWGWLGCRFADLDPETATDLGLNAARGVLIVEVVSESPAEVAGLLRGDIIRGMDDEVIEDVSDLRLVMRGTRSGQVMQFTILRGREPRTIPVILGSRPLPPPPTPPELPN